ncbi:hypothetical protein [Sphingomonas sp. 179-A 2A2 NHS]|uniref:hypothetical protein n=1 Tax=Sphingomonas sp. 179-A 2A2 NHS TaxID=3374290 RepID=UPI00387A1906
MKNKRALNLAGVRPRHDAALGLAQHPWQWHGFDPFRVGDQDSKGVTLLISIVRPEFLLACSDQRITAANSNGTQVLDERFNKHIVFGSEDYGGSISYTGLARWRLGGKIHRLYDIISEAVAASIVKRPTFGQLCLDILGHLMASIPTAQQIRTERRVELHIVARHKAIPVNIMTVLSNFRTVTPWGTEGGNLYDYELGPFRVFLKTLVDETDVIFGGMENFVSAKEKAKLRHIVGAGANAFQCAQLAAKIMDTVARRTPTVGSRCAAVVHPYNDYVDTNLWGVKAGGFVAFMPRMVMINGTIWGPSHFPTNLPLAPGSQIPEQSLFYKALVTAHVKRRLRRLMFRRRKGPLIPSLMGFIGLILFGQVQPGYDDFGLGREDKPDT